MRSYLKKDHLYRLQYKRGELLKLKRGLVRNNEVLAIPVREEAHKSYVKIEGAVSSLTRIRNRCLQTGRGRGVITT